MPTLWVLALFGIFYKFWFHVQTRRHLGGGGMCILFEICKKTPFQKCMGWGGGGGGHIFQHSTTYRTVHTNMALDRSSIFILNHCHRQHSGPFFRQGWDPIRADIPLFVDRDIFLQFLPILQPLCLHWHSTFIKGHGPQASVVRSTLRCLVGRYGAFLPSCRAHPETPAPSLHP